MLSVDREKFNYQYALSAGEKALIKTFSELGIRPTIIAICDIHHGTTYIRKAIDYFNSKGIEVVTVSSSEGLTHPIFTSHFNGIY